MNSDSGISLPDKSGMAVQHNIGTDLAHERTDLAVIRSALAAERTLMAWIRTSLSMISFGFTIGKLKEILVGDTTSAMLGGSRTVSPHRIAVFLVILGTMLLVGATLQNLLRIRQLRSIGLQRELNLPAIVAMLLAAIGAFALIALVRAF